MSRFCLDTSALLTLRDNEPLLLSAAELKASHRLSLALSLIHI